MAYPAPQHSGSQHTGTHPGARVALTSPLATPSSTPRCHSPARSHAEGEHQLEKLQFALAVALTRGDLSRSQQLRDQIAALGGNLEEPGT